MHSYSGDPIDGTYQHISERPSLEDEADDVVYATDPEAVGEERAENVPTTTDREEEPAEPERPVVKGQTTLLEWSQL
ncbi:hypothetical protein JMJ58_14795 [Haloterrigena salifodinae]|uniref:Uncharacterized protein n=1 Tax=Haloterrigena salifodinae TaxID=2675099 RepID=A0A8T8DY83_9EURY|nr:hypothetical protein [Haloterrigena salifodinae]QRV14201.1 hypothetical protein JMJ58_14795 [Haloterrigena salifodinae]